MSSILNDLSDVFRKHGLVVEKIGAFEEGEESITGEDVYESINLDETYDAVYIVYGNKKKPEPVEMFSQIHSRSEGIKLSEELRQLSEPIVDFRALLEQLKGKEAQYHLAIPLSIYQEVQRIAESKGKTALDVFKQFIKLGLLAEKIREDANAALILREGERERELVLYDEKEEASEPL